MASEKQIVAHCRNPLRRRLTAAPVDVSFTRRKWMTGRRPPQVMKMWASTDAPGICRKEAGEGGNLPTPNEPSKLLKTMDRTYEPASIFG